MNVSICQATGHLRYLQEQLRNSFNLTDDLSSTVYTAVLASGCPSCGKLLLGLTPCFTIQPQPQTLDSAVGLTVTPNAT